MKRLQITLVFILFSTFLFGQESELYHFLKSIPGAKVEKKDTTSYKEFYILMLPQPVDHNNPDGAKFLQRIYVGYEGKTNPTVIVTEGYGADFVRPSTFTEPARLLNANQLYVEHRYFGPSTPHPTEWKYLTAEQDAGDYHAIRELFGKIFSGKWVATGVSKGGQTTTEYKVYYPNDVDVSIPYVAPLNYSLQDKRIDRHFKKVGKPVDRKKMKDLQFYFLIHKQAIMPVYKAVSESHGFVFDMLDVETAYDYSVLEYPFSFWQYTARPSTIPDTTGADLNKMVRYLVQIVPPFWYTNASKSYAPANYQFFTQLGYYEYNEKPFSKYLKHKDYPNSAFGPEGVAIKWDNSYIHKLKKFIRSKPRHMIFIYGESDPWGATGAKIKNGSGSLKMVQKNGTHGAQIRTLSPEQQEQVYAALKKWLSLDELPGTIVRGSRTKKE